MNNIQELRKIIADAPDGANEIDDTGRYWIYKGDGDYLLWDGREWIENWSPFHTRSLADMRTIIEQEDWIANVEKANRNITESFKYNEKKHTQLLETCDHYKKRSEQLEAKVAELEKAINVIDSACVSWGFAFDIANPKESLNKLLRIETESARDPQICKEAQAFAIEQQAKGVGAFEKLFSFYEPEKDGYIIYAEDAISYCAILREQAKQRKEKG